MTAYFANSPTEIARRIDAAKKADEARLSADPLYVQYKALWADAIKEAANRRV